MRKFFLNVLSVLAFALCACVASVWAEENKSVPDSAWDVRCDKQGADQDQKNHCEIYSRLVLKDTQKRLAEFAVGFPEEKDHARGILILPLGILLQAGIEMSIDDQPPFKVSVRYCETRGCFAYLRLTDPILKMLSDANQATVSFQSIRAQNVNVELSLNGFTRALEQISPEK